MPTLGVNAYVHDAGVALVDETGPVAVLEEERFDRIRKSRGFPRLAIDYLRSRMGVGFDDIDRFALPWSPRRALRSSLGIVLGRFPPALGLLHPGANPYNNFAFLLRILRVPRATAGSFERSRRPPFTYVSHHLAHAFGAFHLSPFERAAILIVDGYGDDCSTSSYVGRDGRIEPLEKNRLLGSIGVLYTLVTDHLGFVGLYDEGKVMGLAAYGTDALYEEFRRVVRLVPGGRYELVGQYFSFDRYGQRRPFARPFLDRFGPKRQPAESLTQRHKDLAFALQRTTEDVLVHVATALARRTGERNLCLAGGVALNCVANGRIAREAGFDRVYVPPNPDDRGVALGAALAASSIGRSGSGRNRFPVDREGASPHLGAEYTDGEMAAALRRAGLPLRSKENVAEFAAEELAAGRMGGWYRGRGEVGPRALGHRSILADPRRPDVRDLLNRDVKQREDFRPFAPSVLAEHAERFFAAVPSPYMSFSVRVHPGRWHQVPAVVHVDGTSRLHTVTGAQDPVYRRLIERFHERTGVPMVLNTSFNRHEPIVGTPDEAIATCLRTGLEFLVLGSFVLTAADLRRAGDHAIAAGGTR